MLVKNSKIILFMTVTLCFLFSTSVASVMAKGGFDEDPIVVDNAGKDKVFSPNGDGIEDQAIISFTSLGIKGDYQVIVDTHGPRGVGTPDGKFEVDGDWSTPVGTMIGGEADDEDLVPQNIGAEWDGTDKPGSQVHVANGTYKILVHIDYEQDGEIDKDDPSYYSEVVEVTVDSTVPQITASAEPFSPDGNRKKDTTKISYQLSENLLALELTIVGLLPQPKTIEAQLKLTSGKKHEITWDGKDGLDTIVEDGNYNCILKGTDSGGNVAEISFSIPVDTEPPVIKTINPADGHITNSPISDITVNLDDKGGSEIDYDEDLTKIKVSGVSDDYWSIDEDQNQLIFPFSKKLETTAQNGQYTITVNAADKAGNDVEKQATFIFDTQKPIITSVKVGEQFLTATTPVSLNESSAIIEIQVKDAGDSDIDFLSPDIAIKGPSNQIINLTQETKLPNIIDVLYMGLVEEGIYTLEIANLSDKANNKLATQRYLFRYVSGGAVVEEGPEVALITPADGAFVNQLDEVMVQINDNSGIGIDFGKSKIAVKDPDNNPVLGKISNDGNLTMTWQILTTPPRDGSKDGEYTVEITLQDKANKKVTRLRHFTFDTQVPRVESRRPKRTQIELLESIEEIEQSLKFVEVVLYDKTSGVDDAEQVSLLDPMDINVGASKEVKKGNNLYTITLVPYAINRPKTDGTDDGVYTIEVTPADRAGNRASNPIPYTFFFVTQPPKVISTTPEKDAFVNQLDTIQIQLLDYSGIGINFEASEIEDPNTGKLVPLPKSTITVKKSGIEIPGKLSNDEKELVTWRITKPRPRDGTEDGEYSVEVKVVNKARISANPFEDEPFTLIFDSQIPTIISTNPAQNSIVSNLSEITVKLNDGLSGVDFINTQVRLLDPNGSPIEMTQTDNGKDTIISSFDPLRTDSSQDGIYTIEVTPVDRASNRAGGASRIEFTYSTKVPEIVSISVGTEGKLLRDKDFYNQVDIIEVHLLDYSGTGIDFDNSKIIVKNPDNINIPGALSRRDENTLRWQISAPLLRDGNQDGMYTIEVSAQDLAGNTGAKNFSFTYATEPPEIVSINPEDNAYVNQVDTVEVQFRDLSGAGIDFDFSTIVVKNPSGKIVPEKLSDDENTRLTWEILTPLSRDGQNDGKYTVEVSAQDEAGNIFSQIFGFTFDSQVPIIASTTPAKNSTVKNLSQVSVTLNDTLSGVDFVNTVALLLDKNNNPIGATKKDNGVDIITLSFAERKTDGSQDGTHIIEIIPADRAGNITGSAYRYEFSLITQPTDIELITPEDNDFVNVLSIIETQILDYSGVGIDFDSSTIVVKNPSGNIVAGKLSDDEDTRLIWEILKPLSRNGNDDGKYTIEVSAQDEANNKFSQEFSFTFDSQIPTIVSTTPAQNTPVKSLSQVSVTLNDVTSGIDFANTQVRLLDKNQAEIGATKTDDGESTITLTFSARKTDGLQDGIHTIEVTPADRAGNIAGSAYRFEFALATKLPEIVSVTPENSAFVNQINTIETIFLDHSGEGIDFDNSLIVVKDKNGQIVSGKLSDDDNATLTWQILTPPSRDGQKDGTYNIEVTVQNEAGTVNTQKSNLTFDSQVPTIISITPSKDSRISTLSQIQVKLNDAISGVDTFNTQVRLLDPNGVDIGATKTDNGIDTITLDFDALKTDGSGDGIYTTEVIPKDRAGNVGSPSRTEFVYVTELPELVLGSIAKFSSLNRIERIEATVADHSGKGIDFAESTIKLKKLDDKYKGQGTGLDELETKLKNLDGEYVDVVKFDNRQNKVWVVVSMLPTDGTMDGPYIIEYQIVDKVGTVADYETLFIYDTLPPSIETISLVTPFESMSLEEEAIINANSVTIDLQVTDGEEKYNKVDFAASTVGLSDPTGVVNGHQSDDGKSKITYVPETLPQAGKYTVEVTLVDKAGNSTIPLKYDFDYQITPPRVLSITPANRSELNSISEITAMLEDNSGTGLDFTSTGSNIQIIGPDGGEVEGTTNHEGDNLILGITLATDGSEDGKYTVIVKPVDNTGTAGNEKRVTFIYDTEQPEIISVTNIDMTANVSLVNGEISRIEAVLVDATPPSGYANNSGIDFETSTVRLKSSDGNIVDGQQGDNDTDKIWWQLSNPLSRGGDADGDYTIEVIAQDLAGNKEEQTYSFLYDTLVPNIVSTTPEEGANLGTSIDQIIVELDDAGSGIDLAGTGVQLLGPSGTIGANKADDGKSIIYLRFKALKVDGSDDGVYQIQVTPKDLAGNEYQSPVLFEFFYITQKPEIISTSPEEKTYVSQLNQLWTVLEDHSGEGIDIKKSTIRLIAPDGKTVSGRQIDDRDVTIRWILEPPLPTDGTADGEYSISIFAVDKAGSEITYQMNFFYDSGIPQITKIIPADGEAIYEPISEITITLTDGTGSGVDLAGTNVKLLDPNGAVISGNQSDDGIDTITYTFEELAVDGFYTIEVTPKDLSGNVSQYPFQYRLSLVLLPPLVETVEVSGETLPQEYLNSLNEITVELEEKLGVGLDLTDAGSKIRLFGPKGEVKGEQEAEGDDTLIWAPILPLATDGSDDGNYTIQALPVNKSGRNGDEVEFQFMYDTVAPEVDLDTIQLKVIESESQNSLSEITVIVTDEQPPSSLGQASSGIDWKNVDDTWIKLENDKGKAVESIVQSDKDKTLIVKLKQPLASNGSQDGEYTVIIAPKDQAGNTTEEVEYKFYYDTKPPSIDMTSLTVSDPQQPDIEPKQLIIDPNDIDYPTSTNAQNGIAITAKITDEGLGVDLTKCTIVVEQPQGGQLLGILTQNGVDTIQFTTSRLAQEGYYRVSVVAVGLDKEDIGINPVDTISASFLFETTKPVALLTDYGGKLTLENESVTLTGTAEDKGQENVPDSGILKVEVGYEDAEGKEQWKPATDDSKKEEKPWSHWSADFLPSESGEYEMLIRVTDEAGNYEIYEGPTLTFTVSLSFFGETYVWPNPIRRNETAHFSFDTNIGEGSNLTVTLSIYDIAGYLVYQKEFSNLTPGRGNDQIVVWKGQNDHGDRVASGVYIFRLEADNGTHQTNAVGRLLVVK